MASITPKDCISCPYTSRCSTYYNSIDCKFYHPKKDRVSFPEWMFNLISKIF